jgi:hypothetical protein
MLTHLFLVASLAAPGDHAALHPAGANLYFEVPDITAARDAYGSTGLARLVADEEVAGLLSQLLGREQEQVGLGTLAGLGVDAVGEMLPVPGAEMLSLMGDLHAASLSVSGLELDGLTGELLASGESPSEELSRRASRAELRGVMDFRTPEAAARVATIIRAEGSSETGSPAMGEWRRSATGDLATDGAGTWSVHVLEGSAPRLSFWLREVGTRIDFAVGFEQELDGPAAIGTPLTEDPAFAASFGRLPEGEGLVVLEEYSSIGDLGELPALAQMVPGLGAMLSSDLGPVFARLLPGGRGATRTRLVGDRFVTDEFEAALAGTDGARLLGRAPLAADTYRLAPGDAAAAWAMTLDREGLNDLLVATLTDLGGADPEAFLSAFEDDHGFRPDRDLIGAIAGDAVLYTMPFTGLGLPKVFLAVELRDPDAFARTLERVAALAADEGAGLVIVEQRPYRKRPFFSFTPTVGIEDLTGDLGMLSGLISAQVAVGVLEDRALLSYNASWAKREMRRWLTRDGVPPHPMAAEGAELPTGAYDHAVTDWGGLLASIYEGARGLLPMVADSLPFAPEDLPSPEVFTRHLRPTVSWSRVVDGGVHTHTESSLGPELSWILGAGSVGAALTFFDLGGEADFEDRARELRDDDLLDPAELTRANLDVVRMGLQVHVAAKGRYPARLEELRQSVEGFPEGILRPEQELLDGWGHPLHYEADAEGATYRLWSVGPDGVEQFGEGDDILDR